MLLKMTGDSSSLNSTLQTTPKHLSHQNSQFSNSRNSLINPSDQSKLAHTLQNQFNNHRAMTRELHNAQQSKTVAFGVETYLQKKHPQTNEMDPN